MFKNPVAVFDQVRAPILGIDTKNPGLGPITGMPYWNVDMSLQKDIRIAETVVFQFSTIFANFFNHNVLKDPGLALYSPSTWGVESAQANNPRQIELGFRISF